MSQHALSTSTAAVAENKENSTQSVVDEGCAAGDSSNIGDVSAKPKSNNSKSGVRQKTQQQPPFRNQRRGSSGNVLQGSRYHQSQGGTAPQRHFSHGGDDDNTEIGQRKYKDQSGDGRRRHSTDGKNKKKYGDGSAAATAGAKHTKLSSSRYQNSLSESTQNGGSGDVDYYTDDFELEEPFSESDEEEATAEARRKRQAKPQLLLPIPRRRIRTLSGTIPVVGYAPVWGGPTMCLGCLEFFDLPSQTSAYVEHLLEKHKIVIADIELIVDVKRYIEYWRHRFGQEPIEKIFSAATPSATDPLYGKVDQYYLMSEAVPEDLQIRERLALRRLDEVLQCQQREREDRTFRRQCLFCRYRSTGNRTKLIHHLYTMHRLNLGSPDNLVFINEYMDVLEGKMKNNQCIYCEQTFADHQTLTDHMKKRGHREVNPKNHYYDKFYVINYLELGKRWLEVLAEDFEDATPSFVDSDEEEEEETWNEWQEDAGEDSEISALCLFCEQAFGESGKLLTHMKDKHKYDLKEIVTAEGLDFYDAVKLINYIRKQTYNLVCFVCDKADLRPRSSLTEHLESDGHLVSKLDKEKWNKEEYLIPTFDNDHLLLFLGEIVEDQHHDEEEFSDTAAAVDTKKPTSILVIPEDPPGLEETVLNDPELRDQLK